MNPKKLTILLSFFLTISTINAQIVPDQKVINQEIDSVFSPYLIAIVVSDVEKSAGWYTKNLGFSIIQKMNFPEYDSLRIVFLKSGNTELELIQKNTSFSIKKFVPDYNGFNEAPLIGIAKIAFRIADAKTLSDRLKANKVKFLVNIYDDKTFNVRSFIIEDLDGNVMQFNQPLPIVRTDN